MITKICRKCRFFSNPGSYGYGSCHRHAPTLLVYRERHPQTGYEVTYRNTLFPEIDSGEGCGDWEPTEKQP